MSQGGGGGRYRQWDLAFFELFCSTDRPASAGRGEGGLPSKTSFSRVAWDICEIFAFFILSASSFSVSILFSAAFLIVLFIAGTEDWRRIEEYFRSDSEDVRGLRLPQLGGVGNVVSP